MLGSDRGYVIVLKADENTSEGSWFVTVLKFFFARTTEVGSRTLVNATEAGEASHGQYLSSCRIAE